MCTYLLYRLKPLALKNPSYVTYTTYLINSLQKESLTGGPIPYPDHGHIYMDPDYHIIILYYSFYIFIK